MRYPQRLYHLEGDITVEPSASIQSMWTWVERFQNECARLNRSPQTIIEYGYDLASLIEYLSHIPLSSFAEADSRILRDYLDWLRLNAEVSTVTLNRRLACLRSFFRFLFEEKAISYNPAAEIRKARERRKEAHTYLLADEASQLLQVIQEKGKTNYPFTKRDLAMIALMLFCGLRISEVAGLNIGDIRFREGVLVVRGKGNKIRELPIENYILGILDDHITTRKIPLPTPPPRPASQQTPMELARTQLGKGESSQEALFLSKRRRRITTRGIRDVVAKYVEEIDLDSSKNISPHKLRHTFATLLYLNGVDINVLRELLGHADLSTTQIYAAVNKDQRRQAMESHPLIKSGGTRTP